MGYSPQSGLPQNNRSGDFDPFAALHLVQIGAYDIEELMRVLTTEGGLMGISGLSGDVRDLEKAAAAGHVRAQVALDVFVYELRKLIGGYAAALGGVDAIAFTGGIGENRTALRARALAGLEFMGVVLDPHANATVVGIEGCISSADSNVAVWVVPTDEESVVAGCTVDFLRNESKSMNQA